MITQDELKKTLSQFYEYAAKKLKINKEPSVVFREDEKNAEDIFGKTAYYDGGTDKIVLYVTGRHAKDILRSFAHELVHHAQREQKKITDKDLEGTNEVGYALTNKKLRKMEVDAFKRGNMIFRDFTDRVKTGEITLNESVRRNLTLLGKGERNMSKNSEVQKLVEGFNKQLLVLEKLAKKKMQEKKAAKDYDGDGKVESGSEEYLGSKDKAIKAAKAGKGKKKIKEAKKEDTKKEAKHQAKKDAKERTVDTDKHGKKHLSESFEAGENDNRPHSKLIVESQSYMYEELLKKFNIE
jgi:hypothetical protein